MNNKKTKLMWVGIAVLGGALVVLITVLSYLTIDPQISEEPEQTSDDLIREMKIEEAESKRSRATEEDMRAQHEPKKDNLANSDVTVHITNMGLEYHSKESCTALRLDLVGEKSFKLIRRLDQVQGSFEPCSLCIDYNAPK